MAEAKKVKIVASRLTTIASMMRGHINTTLAYAKLGMYEEAWCEVDSLSIAYELLCEEIKDIERGDNND